MSPALSEKVHQVLSEARKHPDVSGIEPVKIILRTIPRLTPEDRSSLLPEALRLARQIKRPDYRLETLAEVLPLLDSSTVDAVVAEELGVVLGIDGPNTHMVAASLQALAPFLTEEQAQRTLPTARAIRDLADRVRTLLSLALGISGQEGEAILDDCRFTADLIGEDAIRMRLLAMLLGARRVRAMATPARLTPESIVLAVQQSKGMLGDPPSLAEFGLIYGVNRFYIYRLFPDGGWAEVVRLARASDNTETEDSSLSGGGTMTTPVAIFISHAEKDSRLAEAVVRYLRTSLVLNEGQIRCTSVAGYAHAPGERTSETLRSDLVSCTAVIGLVTPNSLRSQWVLFELGAGWGMNKPVIALLAGGTGPDLLPGPLKERRAGKVTSERYLQEIIQTLNAAGFALTNQAQIGAAVKDLARAGRYRPAASKDQAPDPSKASASVSPLPPQQIRTGLSDADYTILLRGWFSALPSDQKTTPHAFSNVDEVNSLPAGITRRLIALAVRETGFKISKQGEQFFIAESAMYDDLPRTPSITAGIRDMEW